MERVHTFADATDRVKEQLSFALRGTAYAEDSGEDWDYAAADTKSHTHCYHVYPAMMIPQVARRLIRLYGRVDGRLLDPFCGSGTSLVEARMAGMHAVGVDLNPFAVFLARAKTTCFNVETVSQEAKKLRKGIEGLLKQGFSVKPPQFFNIDYWFKPEVQLDLALLRYAIDTFTAPEVRHFFLVAFSATVRESSNVRRGEYKLYRLRESELVHHRPMVFQLFWEKVGRNLRGLVEFVDACNPQTSVQVIEGDTRKAVPLPNACVDLIVTSPPYGDSQTTVAYGQFSRLMLQWLGIEDELAKSIDRRALGGQKRTPNLDYSSPTLERALEQIALQHPKRATQVKQFYDDFAECFPEMTRVAKPGCWACFVVGNRTVKNIRIPTDQILIEIASGFRWRYETTYHRRIPNKRMPLKNSPSNKPGELSATMTEEHIVVLRKE